MSQDGNIIKNNKSLVAGSFLEGADLVEKYGEGTFSNAGTLDVDITSDYQYGVDLNPNTSIAIKHKYGFVIKAPQSNGSINLTNDLNTNFSIQGQQGNTVKTSSISYNVSSATLSGFTGGRPVIVTWNYTTVSP